MSSNFIINLITYIFAMIGFIIVALYVYKQAMAMPKGIETKKFLSVESFLKLSATKNLYVIKAGNERFLIAGDTTNTTLISKLDENNAPQVVPEELAVQIKQDNLIKQFLKRDFSFFNTQTKINNSTENKIN